jgi:hypothetical protein
MYKEDKKWPIKLKILLHHFCSLAYSRFSVIIPKSRYHPASLDEFLCPSGFEAFKAL